jgi:hypothetical protein
MREDTMFSMGSMWWVRPTYETIMLHSSGLLDDDEYDYDAQLAAGHQMPWSVLEPE